jgi:hypothetical protein
MTFAARLFFPLSPLFEKKCGVEGSCKSFSAFCRIVDSYYPSS